MTTVTDSAEGGKLDNTDDVEGRRKRGADDGDDDDDNDF